MSHKATCTKCNIVIIAGFDQETTEKIAGRLTECSYCNDREQMTVTIEKMEEVTND